MNKIDTDTIASFTWMFNHLFFLETAAGNFVWSDSSYPGGDDSIRPFDGTLREFCREIQTPFGRDKGKRFIGDFCGENVNILLDKPWIRSNDKRANHEKNEKNFGATLGEINIFRRRAG
jgi:hypothetical protein